MTNFEFCFSFEAEEPSKHRLQELMWEEMRRYHPEQGPWKGIRPTNGTGAEKEAGSGAGTWGAVGAGAGDGGEARGASGARASRPLGSPRMCGHIPSPPVVALLKVPFSEFPPRLDVAS